MSADQLNLLRGTLDLLVLQALLAGPQHGYGVAKWVRHASGGAIEIEDGALYTALHRMERRGWISAEWGVSASNRRAKYYTLTDAGRTQWEEAETEWVRYSAAMARVLSTGSGEHG